MPARSQELIIWGTAALIRQGAHSGGGGHALYDDFVEPQTTLVTVPSPRRASIVRGGFVRVPISASKIKN